MKDHSVQAAPHGKGKFFRQSAFLAYLLGAFIVILSLIYSDVTIDPVLIPRFLALAVFLSAVLLFFLVHKVRGIIRFDFDILQRGIFPVFLCYFILSVASLFNAINVAEGIFEVLKIFLFMLFLFVITQILIRDHLGGNSPSPPTRAEAAMAGEGPVLPPIGGEGDLPNKPLTASVRKDNSQPLEVIIKSVIIVAVIISITGLFQYYELLQVKQDIHEILIDVRSTLGNKNLFSSAIFLTLPFTIYGIIKFRKYWWFLSLFTLVIALFDIVFLQARAVWLATLISTFIAFLLVMFLSKKLNIIKLLKGYSRKKIVLGMVFLVIMNAGLIIFFTDAETGRSLKSRGESIIGTADLNLDELKKRSYPGAIGARLIMWENTIQMIKDNPIFGVGAGNWKINFPRYGIDNFGHFVRTGIRHYQRPHNDFLWVLSEIGIPGFLFYLLIFIIVFKYILKLVIYAHDEDEKWLALLIFFGITGYLIASFFSFPKERIMHNVLLMTMIAIVVSMYYKNFPLRSRIKPSYHSHVKVLNRDTATPKSLIIIILSLIISLFAIGIGFTRLVSEAHAKQAITAHAVQKWNYLIKKIDKAHTRWYNMDPMATPLSWYRGVANFTLGDHDAAFDDFREAYEIHPYHIHVLNNLATGYELKGDHEYAIGFYKKALAIAPRFEEALINLSAVYFNFGKIDDAYLTIRACDTNTVNPKFNKYLVTILSAKIDALSLSVERPEVKQALIDISNDEELLLRVHKNTLRETADINSYLLKEAVETLTILERRE